MLQGVSLFQLLVSIGIADGHKVEIEDMKGSFHHIDVLSLY